MGYFRRFKLSDYTAQQCKAKLRELELDILSCSNPPTPTRNEVIAMLEQWACFRELLARHENQNKSQLDKK
jgi:hypothetical protein